MSDQTSSDAGPSGGASSNTDKFVEALRKIRGDRDLSHQFMQDPHGTLRSMGVHVGKSATAAAGAPAAASVCVGACVCVG